MALTVTGKVWRPAAGSSVHCHIGDSCSGFTTGGRGHPEPDPSRIRHSQMNSPASAAMIEFAFGEPAQGKVDFPVDFDAFK